MPLGAVVEALLLLLLERRVAGVAGHRRHLGRLFLPPRVRLGPSFGGLAGGGGEVVAAVAGSPRLGVAFLSFAVWFGVVAAGAAGGEEAN